MELRQIRHLIAVIEHGSYARAADALGLTQSALTQSIGRLEMEAGLPLLERGRFGAVPTEGGRLLATRARFIDAEMRVARSELDALKGATRGDLSIGVGKSVVQNLAPTAVARFVRQRPDTVVTAYEGWSTDLFARLLRGELDFVVSAAVPQLVIDPELRQELLFEQHEVVVVSKTHPLAKRQTVTLADLVGWHWVVPPAGNGRVRHLQDVFRTAGVQPPTRFVRTDSVVFLQSLIHRSEIVGLATVELLGDTSSLVTLEVPELTEARRACLTFRRRSRPSTLASMLADDFRHVAAGLARRS